MTKRIKKPTATHAELRVATNLKAKFWQLLADEGVTLIIDNGMLSLMWENDDTCCSTQLVRVDVIPDYEDVY